MSSVKIADVAARFKAVGVEQVRSQVLGLDRATQRMGRTTRQTNAILDRRLATLQRGTQVEATREISLRKLTGVENTLTAMLQRGNLSLDRRIALETRLATVQNIRAAATQRTAAAEQVAVASRGAATAAGAGGLLASARTGVAGFGGLIIAGKVASAFGRATRAADDLEAAERKLNATSKLTGVALGDIHDVAEQVEDKFSLSRKAAADWVQNAIKMTSRAGDTSQSLQFLVRWLDLSAAQGLDAATALQALETTLIGQDEGLNRLGLANPSGIYEEWARAAGTSAAKMTEAQKAQAIINEVVEAGSKVEGEYANMLDTAAGASERRAQAVERLAAAYGGLFAGIRVHGSGVLTELAEGLTALQPIMARVFGRFAQGVAAMSGFGAISSFRQLQSMQWDPNGPRAIAPPTSVTPGGTPGATPAAPITITAQGPRRADPVTAAQNELAILRAKWADVAAADDTAYREGLSSLSDYFAGRQSAAATAAQAEIRVLAAERRALVDSEPESDEQRARRSAEVAKVDTQIAVRRLALQREQRQLTEEEAAAREHLLEQRLNAEERVMAITGQQAEVAARALQREVDAYDLVLRQLGVVESEREALVAAYREPLQLRTDFDQAAEEASAMMRDLQLARDRIEQNVRAGVLTQVQGEQEILEAERERAQQLQLIAERMAVFAALLKDPELLAAAEQLGIVIRGLGIKVDPEAQVKQEKERLAKQLDDAFADLPVQGIATFAGALGMAATQGMGSAGDMILSSLGGIFTSMGTSLLTFGNIMSTLLPALSNPFTSGPAALIAGAALVALGTAFSAAAGGRGGSGSAGRQTAAPQNTNTTIQIGTPGWGRSVGGATERVAMAGSGAVASRASTELPKQATPVTVTGNVFASPYDQGWQRAITQVIRQAQRNGALGEVT